MINRYTKYAWSFACLVGHAALADADTDAYPRMSLPSWSHARIQEVHDEGIDLGKMNPVPGLHIVPLSESWSTTEYADIERKKIEQQRRQGFYSAEVGEVVNVRSAMRAASTECRYLPWHDRAFLSLKEVQRNLLVQPVGLGSSALSTAGLLEIRLGGSNVEGKWTGLARSFDVPELGLVILNETDHVAGNESVTMIKEWVNIEVNGQPGTAKTARDASGRTLVTVGWANERKLYSLQLQPLHPETHAVNQAKLLEIARKLIEA